MTLKKSKVDFENKITRSKNIAELITEHPEVSEVLMAFGLNCVMCYASQYDTLEEGAKVHQMSDEEIDEMIEEINQVISGEYNI